MKIIITAVILLLFSSLNGQQKSQQNLAEGVSNNAAWIVLFDGTSLDAWISSTTAKAILASWEIRDSLLISKRLDERPKGVRASLLTKNLYADFEFVFEFKLEAPTASHETNSGVKYFVYPNTELGLEYQLFATTGEASLKHAIGDLYDILPATGAVLRSFDEWNSATIISKGKMCEHWLNGLKVLEFERGGELYRAGIAKSKFQDQKNFGEQAAGHIMLQDHDGGVVFRNIKIRKL